MSRDQLEHHFQNKRVTQQESNTNDQQVFDQSSNESNNNMVSKPLRFIQRVGKLGSQKVLLPMQKDKISKPGSQSSSRQKTLNGIPIAIMSPSSINNMVTNERFVFFRHDDTNNSVANQSIMEDNESLEDLEGNGFGTQTYTTSI